MESSKALPCGLRPTSLMAFPRFVHVSKWSFSVSTWDGRTAGLISTYHPASSFAQDCFLTSSACVFFYRLVPTPRRTLISGPPILKRTCMPYGTQSTFPTFSRKYIWLASSLLITHEENRELIRGLPNCKRRESLIHPDKHQDFAIYFPFSFTHASL